MNADWFTSPAQARNLIEATTTTVAPRRKRARRSAVPPVAKLVFFVAILSALLHFFR